MVLNLISLSFARVGAGALTCPAGRSPAGFSVVAARSLARFSRASPDEGVWGYESRLLPAHLLPLILLVQPLLQRREVFEQRVGVDLAFAGQHFQRVRPRFALSHG
jgi:hypothetical protein